MKTGDIIRIKRKELNMTQEDLAEAVGTTKPTVSRWESGAIKKMKPEIAHKVASILHLDEKMFIYGDLILFPDEYYVVEAYRAADIKTRTHVRKILDLE